MRRLSRPPRRLLAIGVLALVVLFGSAGLVLRVTRGGDSDEQPAGASSMLLAFAEYGPTSDRIYTSPAGDPARRTLIDTVPHADGWGINPSPEPAGTLFAYTVLPPASAGRRDAPAELWSFDLATGNKTRLARDADLLIAPVLSRDGSKLVYRASDGDGQALVVVDLGTRLRTVLHRARTDFGMYPIGFDADGAIIYASLSLTGTDVYRLVPGDAPALLFHASDDIGRDWRLSPDGRSLSFLAPRVESERVVYRARVISLAGATERSLTTPNPIATEQYGPVWAPDGAGVTVGQEASTQGGQAVAVIALDGTVHSLPGPTRGFDVPLAWSEDGAYLAVRAFDGTNSAAPGNATIVLIVVADGERVPITTGTELIFIGWIGRA